MLSQDYISGFLPSSLSSIVLGYKAVGVWGLETKEEKPDEVNERWLFCFSLASSNFLFQVALQPFR